jgi:hypothetical protein
MTPFVEPTSAGTGQGQLLVAVREERAGCLCLVDGALPAVRAILAVGTPMQFEESGSRILPVENDKRRSPAFCGEINTCGQHPSRRALRVREEVWVGPAGLEPATRGLKVRCSTN